MNWTGGRLSRAGKKGSGALTAQQKQHYAKVRASKEKRSHKWSSPNVLQDNIQPQASKHLQLSTQHALQTSHRPSHEPQSTQQYSRTQEMLRVKRERVSEDNYYDATPPPRKFRRVEGGDMVLGTGGVTLQYEDPAAERRRKLLFKGDWVGVTFQKPVQMQFAPSRQDERVGRRRKAAAGYRARYSTKQPHITSPYTGTKWNHFGKLEDGKTWTTRDEVRISIGERETPRPIKTSLAVKTRHASVSSRLLDLAREPSSDVMLLDNNTTEPEKWARTTNGTCVTANQSAESSSSLSNNHESYSGWDILLGESLAAQNEGQERRAQRGNLRLENQGSRLSTSPSKYYESYDGWETPLEESEDREIGQEGQEMNEAGSHSGEWNLLGANSKKDNGYARHRGRRLPAERENSAFAPQSRDIQFSDTPNQTPTSFPIFSSASGSLHHPKPQGSGTKRFLSRVLESESSGLPDSTTAEVGQQRHIVPSSQVLDNAIWETWMFPSEDDAGLQDLDGEEVDSTDYWDDSISPGISSAQRRFHAVSRGYSEDHDNDDGVDHMDQSHIMEESTRSASMSPRASESSLSLPARHRPYRKQDIIHVGSDEAHHIALRQDERQSLHFPNPHVPDAPREEKEASRAATASTALPDGSGVAIKKISMRPTQLEDPDEMWMKFAFGGSSDSAVEVAEHIARSFFARQELKKTVRPSPMLGLQSADTCVGSSGRIEEHRPFQSSLVAEYSGEMSSQPITDRWKTSQDATHASSSQSRASRYTTGNAEDFTEQSLASQSMMNHASSASSREKLPSKNAKIVFTKPRPFVGRNAKLEAGSEQEALHIGRRLATNDKSAGENDMNRDSFSLVDLNKMEPIEDD